MATAMPVQDRDQSSARRVCLGVIATAHGVRGLVKVLCEADDPHMLDQNGPLFTSENGPATLSLILKNSMGKYWLAEVEGIGDRDAALTLRGTKLWIERDKLPGLESEDEFYIEDLIGLRAEDSDGNDAGTILAVENFGAGDLLEIKPPQGASYYLPFTKANVPTLSLADGKVVIVPHG